MTKRKKILVVYQYFRPEIGAGVERVFYFAKRLILKGIEVKVLTGFPNYPTGKVYPGYKLGLLKSETLEGIDLVRTFVFPAKYTSTLKRLFNYLSFTISASLFGIFQPGDLIISSSPPLTSGAVGWVLSVLKRRPLIFETQDVWPGAAIELGMLKNKFLIKIARKLERMIYKKADFIVAPTEGTKKLLLLDNPFLTEEKIKVVANSVDLNFFDTQQIKKELVEKYKSEKFTVVYTGTLGLQQGISTLTETIKLLKNNDQIRFLVIGEGVDKGFLEEAKTRFSLDNLTLLSAVEYKIIPSYLKVGDVGLVLLKKNKYQDAALAVKAFDYFAAKLPVIVSGGAEMQDLIYSNKVGYWVEAENPDQLSKAIVRAYKDSKNKLFSMGERGRKLVENKYNKKIQFTEWEKIIDRYENFN